MDYMRKTLVVFLLVAMCPNGAVPAETRRKMPHHAEHLYGMIADFAHSSAREDWLRKNSNILSMEVANEARDLMGEAVRDGQLELGINAGVFSAAIYGAQGRHYEESDLLIMVSDISFNQANDISQYERVKEQALNILNIAQSRGFKDISFRAAVLAADCEYFSLLQGKHSPGSKELVLLKYLAQASLLINQEKQEVWLERYLSLVAGTYDQSGHRMFPDGTNDQIDDMFRTIVPRIESLGKWEPRSMTGNIDMDRKTIRKTSVLGELSYRYGNPDLGDKRFVIAEERARGLKDVEGWIETVHDHYIAERSYRKSHQHFAKLRESLSARMDDLREAFRSRIGRIWAGYKLESLKGEFLRHEMRERKQDIDELEPLWSALGLRSSMSVLEKNNDQVFREIASFKAATLRDEIAGFYITARKPSWAKQVRELEQRVLGFEPDNPTIEATIQQEMMTVSQLSFARDSSGDRPKVLQAIEHLSTLRGLGFAKSLNPATLSEVMNVLLPSEALIEYFIPHDPTNPSPTLFIFTITRDKTRVSVVDLDELFKKGILKSETGFVGRISVDGKARIDITPLSELIVELRYALRTSDDKTARQQLRILHQLLIAPIMRAGVDFQKYQHLIIVPHGMLHYVPFPALVTDNDRFLIEDVAISIVPSASVLIETLRTQRTTPASFIGFGDSSLQRAEKEILKIVGSLSGIQESHYTTKGTATESNFKKSIPGKAIVHVTAHGNFPAETALFSQSIILGKDQDDDGILEAEEIKNLDLRSASLVVLSICNGTLYRIGPADEPFGLVRAFLVAGAQNVMGTLWPLEEEFSYAFMSEFYRHLLPHGPAKAFQEAAKKFTVEGELIWRWAGFTVVGSGRAY